MCTSLCYLPHKKTFCTRMEHRHLRGVHYLEFTRVINCKAPVDFRWVLSKGMKFIYILNSIVFPCMHVVPWVLKHNTNYQAKQFQSATKD